MRTGCIYKITCPNGYYLYGSTIQFEKRKSNYKSDLIKGNYNNIFLQRVFNKYGWEAIQFKVVQTDIPESILSFVEDVWIGMHCSRVDDNNKGMNMRDGSRVNHTEESRRKISNAHKGRKQPKETIDKRIKTMRENHKPRSEESRNKTSKSLMGHNATSIQKRIAQFNINEELIKSWDSITEAANALKIQHSSISKCLNGHIKHAGGFVWKFK